MLKVKICGLKYAKNIEAIAQLKPDLMGFIFYKGSKRYAGDEPIRNTIVQLPESIKKVGVFVNESIEVIVEIKKQFQLDHIQLHGDESPAYCRELQQKQVSIIKAFQVDEAFDFTALEKYQAYCDLFLFDTKTANYGGSGLRFDWRILDNYTLSTPFLLAGGLGEDTIQQALVLKHKMLYGFDLNSKVETVPGEKNIETITNILNTINKHEYIKTR